MRKLFLIGLALLLFASLTVAAQATVTIYTNKALWAEALDGLYLTENFSDSVLNPGVSYTSSESGGINTKFGYYHDVLQSASQNEPKTVWYFTPKITAYGGNWTLGGPGGSGNSLLVYINDTNIKVGSISNSYNGGFWGFVSDTPFTSVLLVGGTGTNQQIYKLDDMVYCPNPVFTASFAAVSFSPLPSAALLFGSGFLMLVAWRKKRP